MLGVFLISCFDFCSMCRGQMKTYSTKRKKPTSEDANYLGYVFARKPDRIGYEGVIWSEVRWPNYDRWSPAEFYKVPGDKTCTHDAGAGPSIYGCVLCNTDRDNEVQK